MSELFVVVFNAMFGKNEVRLFRGGVKSLIILSGSTAHGIKKLKLWDHRNYSSYSNIYELKWFQILKSVIKEVDSYKYK